MAKADLRFGSLFEAIGRALISHGIVYEAKAALAKVSRSANSVDAVGVIER